ncbi:MAG: hypothetical protein K2O97_00765, partial [Acetatifactor sp.]|nr:hypothetical protein [Acetatifactor sp.]
MVLSVSRHAPLQFPDDAIASPSKFCPALVWTMQPAGSIPDRPESINGPEQSERTETVWMNRSSQKETQQSEKKETR